MAYNTHLAERVREYLEKHPEFQFEEKKMFGGLGFMVNGKMCINISGDKLMCRFDPKEHPEIEEKSGYETMYMKGKSLYGYCYVQPYGFTSEIEFTYWMQLCLSYNHLARSSKKK